MTDRFRTEIIGDATLILGDCREILPTLGRVDAVVTDPPYGMNWDTNCARFTGGPNSHGKAASRDWGHAVVDDDKPFDPSPFLDFEKVVLFGANHFAARLPVGTTLIWLKRMDAGFGSFLSDGEVAWEKGGHGVYAFRDLSLMSQTRYRVHPTQKPLPLMRWCIQRQGPKGQTILDPFMGSGTTGVACASLERKFIGIEIEPKYFDIACRRIEEAWKQPRLFEEPRAKPVQESFLGGLDD